MNCTPLTPLSPHQRPRVLEVGWGVDGDGMVGGLDGLEAEAVGDEAELLQRFAGLEFGGAQGRIGGEGRAIVAVDAEVAPV